MDVNILSILVEKVIRDKGLWHWFNSEEWVRIDSNGDIAGPCGTSKNTRNPDRCLPKKKALSLTRAERASTARKKKQKSNGGRKQFVPNTKKARVDRTAVREIIEQVVLELRKKGKKDDRCTRIAKQVYDSWPSAYASGAVVRCRRGEIWKDKK